MAPMGKAPGPDGLTLLYYKNFKDMLTPQLTILFNVISQQGASPPEMMKAIISTIPKLGKAPKQCTNYRPI